MNVPLRAAVYLRVSTGPQGEADCARRSVFRSEVAGHARR